MVENKERYIPFSRVGEETDRISMQILPPSFLDPDGIGMNVKRTEYLMNLGGIGEITVKPARTKI